MARQNKKNAKKLKQVIEVTAGHVSALAAASDADHASRWPRDCQEMAHRITLEGGTRGWNVPNRDREILAKRLPVGALTRRDGTSIRPFLTGDPQEQASA